MSLPQSLVEFARLAGDPRSQQPLELNGQGNQFIVKSKGRKSAGYRLTVDGYFDFHQQRGSQIYENEQFVNEYLLHAYGYAVVPLEKFGRVTVRAGDSEGLYRTVAHLAAVDLFERQRHQTGHAVAVVVGCGTGRTVYEIARLPLPVWVFGFDLSSKMVRLTNRLLVGGRSARVDLSASGLGKCVFPGHRFKNVFVAKAHSAMLPLQTANTDQGVDLIVLDMVLDRLSSFADVEASIRRASSVAKRDASLIIAMAGNWISEETWERFGGSRAKIVALAEAFGWTTREAFDNVPYKERHDRYSTHLELPVLIAYLKRRFS